MASKTEEHARAKEIIDAMVKATTKAAKVQGVSDFFSYLATTNHLLQSDSIAMAAKMKLAEFSRDAEAIPILKPGAAALCAKLKTLRPKEQLRECIAYLDKIPGANNTKQPLTQLLNAAIASPQNKEVTTNLFKTALQSKASEFFVNSGGDLLIHTLDNFIYTFDADDEIKPTVEQVCKKLYDIKHQSVNIKCIKRYPLPLIDALKSNDNDAVKVALRAFSGDINAPIANPEVNNTPLMLGLYWGNLETVRLLLEAGADPNKSQTQTPLEYVFTMSHNQYQHPLARHINKQTKEVVELLISHGANPTHRMYREGLSRANMNVPGGYTDLIAAVEGFVARGTPLEFPPNLFEKIARTAEMFTPTTRQECKKFVNLCIQHGASTDINIGLTPLRIYVLTHDLEDIFPTLALPTNNNNLSNPLPPSHTNTTAVANTANVANTTAVPNMPVELAKRKDEYAIVEEDGIMILTIPRGTLLYHSMHISEYDPWDIKSMKLMGGVVPPGSIVDISGNTMTIKGCIDQFMQKFFYSNPAGGPGLGSTTQGGFNTMAVFDTTRDMRFAILMSPSKYHRLQGESHPAKMSCDRLDPKMCDCTRTDHYGNNYNNYNNNYNNNNHWGGGQRGGRGTCPHAHHYDVCLTPEFLHAHALDGHIAIANEDSYNTRMKQHNREFTYFYDYSKVYRTINRILYDGGRSKDIRREKTITGFPELVIHLFGTDWYNREPSIDYEYTINLPDGHDEAVQHHALMQFVAKYNSGKVPPPGSHTGLRLIAHSTAEVWYNLLRGVRTPVADVPKNLSKADVFYINAMRAHLDGDMPFYFDARTGFLIHDTPNGPHIRLEDGAVISFKEASMRGGESARGTSALERSYMARRAGAFWDRKDCLIPIDDMAARGGRRATRRMRKSRTLTASNTIVPVRNNTRKLNRRVVANVAPARPAEEPPMRPNRPRRKTVRLEYTPTPMTAEEHTLIRRALAAPPSATLDPYDMGPQTHALMEAMMVVTANTRR